MKPPIVESFAAQPFRLCGERLNSQPGADPELVAALCAAVALGMGRTIERLKKYGVAENFRPFEQSYPLSSPTERKGNK
jgi:hypothetical protein